MRSRKTAASLILPLVLWFGACAPGDPRKSILEERERWQVQLLSWTEDAAGLILSTKVSGPVHSELRQLTIRVEMLDSGGTAVDDAWHTIDLSGIERGEFKDVLIRMPAPQGVVEGIAIDRVLRPSPDQESRIPELAPNG